MSLQNPSYSAIELTKRILEIEALRDHHESIYFYRGIDYVDEKEEYVNTYLVSKRGHEIVIKEFTDTYETTSISRIMTIEDFAQFANNNKLELFNYNIKEEADTFRPVHYNK